MTQDGLIASRERIAFGDAPSRARRLVTPGDTIISTVRTYLRAIAFVPPGAEDLIVSTGFATVTPGPEMDPRFLFWWLRSPACVEEVVGRSVGVSYPAVSASDVGDIGIPVPSLDEQQMVSGFLDQEDDRLTKLIAEFELQIDLLREHRQALVTAATMGQLDAARTPADA